MIWPLLLIMLQLVYADPTWKWANAIKIVEKHEFYKNNEVLVKPKNSWQILFAVLYQDSNLRSFKDCVYYQVPGDEAGVLKIKTIPAINGCEEFLYRPGDQEWRDIRALQYSIVDNLISISLTNAKFEISKWDVVLFNAFEHPQPKILMSSAEYRSPKVIYLTPYKGKQTVKPQPAMTLTNKKICHEITEDCQEKSPSVCSQCPGGWYEIPNGCPVGPKFCGSITCGLKNQPACRRGYKFQRSSSDTFRCRDDHSFAYCAKGLIVQCQGNLPYCI